MMLHSKKMVGMAKSALVFELLLGFLPMSFARGDGNPEPCRPGFDRSPVVFKCYHFVLVQMQWEEAREHCLAVGGVLLEITDPAEIGGLVALGNQKTLPAAIPPWGGRPVTRFWTGGQRVVSSYSGSPFRWEASGKPLPRDSPLWKNNEPNNHGNRENYVELSLTDQVGDSKLNDNGHDNLFSICEAPLLV